MNRLVPTDIDIGIEICQTLSFSKLTLQLFVAFRCTPVIDDTPIAK